MHFLLFIFKKTQSKQKQTTESLVQINSFRFYQVKIALIGIRAGSSGLNLTSADIVVFLELPTNPADIQQVPLILSHELLNFEVLLTFELFVV